MQMSKTHVSKQKSVFSIFGVPTITRLDLYFFQNNVENRYKYFKKTPKISQNGWNRFKNVKN